MARKTTKELARQRLIEQLEENIEMATKLLNDLHVKLNEADNADVNWGHVGDEGRTAELLRQVLRTEG